MYYLFCQHISSFMLKFIRFLFIGGNQNALKKSKQPQDDESVCRQLQCPGLCVQKEANFCCVHMYLAVLVLMSTGDVCILFALGPSVSRVQNGS